MQNLVVKLFKNQPIQKQMKQVHLLSNSLINSFISKSMILYESLLKKNLQQELIKNLIKYFDQKGNICKKLKILVIWIQIFKQTKYDLSDIMVNKKIKIFTKSTLGKTSFILNQHNLQQYIQHQILIPLYNYFMKLSINQDLYKHCLIGKIPDNDVFRRGTKIRFIWIFKIYNLIYLLLPIVKSCVDILQIHSNLIAMLQISHVLYRDLLTMNNFIIQALQQGSDDNFLLMPYLDMLQFYQSLTEQKCVIVKINEIYVGLLPHQSMKTQKPRVLNIDNDIIAQIETQAIRVKLISCSLKNPKKDHSRLFTQYQQELIKQKNRLFKTEQCQKQYQSHQFNQMEEFQIKCKMFQQ